MLHRYRPKRIWERTGRVPIEPAYCTDTDFKAHYFSRNEDDEIGGFKEYEDTLIKKGLTLTGDRVFDDSDNGELFVSKPPKLKRSNHYVWARVGEEKRNGGWEGENFKPADQCLADVLNGRQGRFFIRVYDKYTKLLDSAEFRYFTDLREILVNDEPYSREMLLSPSVNGHTPTTLKLMGANDTLVCSTLAADHPHAKVGADGMVTIKPHPEGDKLSFSLNSKTGSIDIVIKLPRIWWHLEQTNNQSSEWRDTPIEMAREEFRNHAYADAKMTLRLPPRIRSVYVGFDDNLDRQYKPNKVGDDTVLPLDNFVDYSQIANRLNNDVSFKIQCDGKTLTLIRVTAGPMPEIISFTADSTVVRPGETVLLQWSTKNVSPEDITISPSIGQADTNGSKSVTLEQTTTFTLRLMDDVIKTITVAVLSGKPFASVKSPNRGGWRRGKGFSDGELSAAGISPTNTMNLPIPIDKRRRSSHKTNIAILMRN